MKRFLITLCILLVMVPGTVYGAEEVKSNDIWDELADTTYKALQFTKEEKFEEAKQFLEKFSVKFLKQNQKQMGLSMLQLRILTVSYDDAVKSLTSVKESKEKRVNAVMKFYLVIDALRSNENPLWMKTKNQVMDPFNKMRKAVSEKNEQSFQYHLNEFLNEYEMIHPAINVDLEDFVMARIDSRIRFLMDHRTHFFSDPKYAKQLGELEKELTALFEGELKQSMNPALPWLIVTIGGLIIVTLFYVGWRKYRAEKQAARLKRHSRYY